MIAAAWAAFAGSALGRQIIKWGAIVGGALLAVAMFWRAARNSGKAEARTEALQRSLETKERADEAAADARGAGADQRLRDGTF